jgi:chemotaxis protein CheX
MDQNLVEQLATAVCQALVEMTGVEFTRRSAEDREAPAALGDIVATLELSGPFAGLLVMSFGTQAAEALAARVLAEVHEEVTPALVRDCMGEITNVIAGQAKALLKGTPYHFTFSAPVVVAAADFNPSAASLGALVLTFDSAVGGCALQLCMPRA